MCTCVIPSFWITGCEIQSQLKLIINSMSGGVTYWMSMGMWQNSASCMKAMRYSRLETIDHPRCYETFIIVFLRYGFYWHCVLCSWFTAFIRRWLHLTMRWMSGYHGAELDSTQNDQFEQNEQEWTCVCGTWEMSRIRDYSLVKISGVAAMWDSVKGSWNVFIDSNTTLVTHEFRYRMLLFRYFAHTKVTLKIGEK